MFSRIYHYLRGPNPLHPELLEGRLSPLCFRRFVKEDLPQCRDLYTLNEPGRFPAGLLEPYERALLNAHCYFLVAESEGQIVASGGISHWQRKDAAVLCYGLVRPSHQGRGIGTALLLARLSLLNPTLPEFHIVLFAVEKSIGFYQRFGFHSVAPWQDSYGGEHPSGHLLFTSAEIRRCRNLLNKHGIVVPQDQDQVPLNDGWDLSPPRKKPSDLDIPN